MTEAQKNKVGRKNAFEYLAFGLGGLVPIILAIVFSEIGLTEKISDEGRKTFFILSGIYIIVGSIIFGLTRAFPNKHLLNVFLYTLQSFISLLIIFFFVSYFGGVKESVFVFSYLYLPAVVGYVWGSLTLVVTSIFCTALFSLNVFMPNLAFEFINWISSKNVFTISDEVTKIDWLYYLVFLIQIFVTTILATRSTMKKRLSNQK